MAKSKFRNTFKNICLLKHKNFPLPQSEDSISQQSQPIPNFLRSNEIIALTVLVIQVVQLALQDIKDSCQPRFKLRKVEQYLMVSELHWNIP